jgi:hypothetical protein
MSDTIFMLRAIRVDIDEIKVQIELIKRRLDLIDAESPDAAQTIFYAIFEGDALYVDCTD